HQCLGEAAGEGGLPDAVGAGEEVSVRQVAAGDGVLEGADGLGVALEVPVAHAGTPVSVNGWRSVGPFVVRLGSPRTGRIHGVGARGPVRPRLMGPSPGMATGSGRTEIRFMTGGPRRAT